MAREHIATHQEILGGPQEEPSFNERWNGRIPSDLPVPQTRDLPLDYPAPGSFPQRNVHLAGPVPTPDTPEPQDVDALFPPSQDKAAAKDVDALFPQSIEDDRVRRQLGANPIADFLFTTDGPVGTIFDHTKKILRGIGHGIETGWGWEPLGLKEDTIKGLKERGVWNDYEKGQKDVVKAVNETLIRQGAIAFDAAVRAGNLALTIPQAVVAEGGGKLGRELAAVPEAFFGSPHPTGIPAIERARDAGVVGPGGESAYHGYSEAPKPTAAEVASAERAAIHEAARSEAEAPAATGQPAPETQLVAPQAPKEPTSTPAAPEPAPYRPSPVIVSDAQAKLLAAGRSAEEAQAAAELTAAYWQTRAERFEGAKGTAEEMYAREAPNIYGPSGPPKPPGRERTLIEFLADRGGIDPSDPLVPDLRVSIGRNNQWVPRVGPLIRKGGMTLHRAREAAVEAGYLTEGGGAGPAQTNIDTLLQAVDAELRGQKQYPRGYTPEPTKADLERNAEAKQNYLERELDAAIEEGYSDKLPPDVRAKVIDVMDKKGVDPVAALGEVYGVYAQGKAVARGHIRPGEKRNTITLLKDANESTFIHETAHDWLYRMTRDSVDPAAPLDLIDDAKTVFKWLGVDGPDSIKRRHHEKFARGFENYMREGKAPSPGLAHVFEKFREWLVKIYETATRLRSPINDEIRGVFDRLLAPEGREHISETIAKLHEEEVSRATPENTVSIADTIRAERDRLAAEHIPGLQDGRFENVASGASRREAGSAELNRPENAPEPVEGRAPSVEGAGEVGASGGSAPVDGVGAPTKPREAGKYVDKAGNIRLDTLEASEDVKNVLRETAAQNDEFMEARRGVISDADLINLVDLTGVSEKISRRKIGEAWNAEEIKAAATLMVQSADDVVRLAKIVKNGGNDADVLAYAEAQARHRMIQEQVAGITAEAGRALRAFRAVKNVTGSVADLNSVIKNETGKTLYQLRQEANLLAGLETPQQISRAIDAAWKPTFKDMFIEGWMAFILSGVKTHLANITGNTIVALTRPVETALSAGIGKVTPGERVYLGEGAAELFGIVQGAKEGVVAAVKSFRSGEQLTGANALERVRSEAIPGVAGTVIRTPLRVLQAEDEFFKAVAFRQSVNRQAYRIAKDEGLSGSALNNRIAELSMTPTEEMVGVAKKFADYQTFQKELGELGKALQRVSNANVATKMIVPFVRTPLNLLKYSTERTPLGLFSKEVRDNLVGKNGAQARDTQLARMALGTIAGIAVIDLAAQKLITGGGPTDAKEKDALMRTGWRPYSIRIGDAYYPFDRLDPWSVVMGLAADAYEVAHATTDGEDTHIAQLLFASISKNITDRSSLRGVSDIMQAATDFDRFGRRYVNNLIASAVVPSIVRQVSQERDPIVRDARSLLDNIKARTPWSADLAAKNDVWGQPITRPPLSSTLPTYASVIKNDPVEKELAALGIYPGKLKRELRGIDLTDKQYEEYTHLAGVAAKQRLDMAVRMPGFSALPPSIREKILRDGIRGAHEQVQQYFLLKHPEIMMQATKNKLDAYIEPGTTLPAPKPGRQSSSRLQR